MKGTIFILSLALGVLVGTSGANASDPIAGTWGITAIAIAALGEPTSGACRIDGTVPASLYDSVFQFSGGTITISSLGINIGDTKCLPPNFQGSGTYTVVDKSKGSFEVDGTFSTTFVGSRVACSSIALTDVSLTIIGNDSGSTFSFFIKFASGTYAEGPSAGPNTCTAPIEIMTGQGSGKKF
jgi:hypothetical protein